MADEPAVFISEILDDYSKGKGRDYHQMTNDFSSEATTDEQLVIYLKGLTACASRLDRKYHQMLIRRILNVSLAKCGEQVSTCYADFLINLVSAFPTYAHDVLRVLVGFFAPKASEDKCFETLKSPDIETVCKTMCPDNIHRAIKMILEIVPLAPKLLMPLIKHPSLIRPAIVHELYVTNIIKLLDYIPKKNRYQLLNIVIHYIGKLDVQVPRDGLLNDDDEEDDSDDEDDSDNDSDGSSSSAEDDDIFQMDGVGESLDDVAKKKDLNINNKNESISLGDKNTSGILSSKPEGKSENHSAKCEAGSIDKMSTSGGAVIQKADSTVSASTVSAVQQDSPEANKIDSVMCAMFDYVDRTCRPDGRHVDWENARDLYKDLLVSFRDYLLKTRSSYVQFLMFYVCSLDERLCEGFLDYLWHQVKDVNRDALYRQIAASYLASYLARASYVKINVCVVCLGLMAEWIHAYILSVSDRNVIKADVSVHGPFYSVVQALLYVFTFRHNIILQEPGGKKRVENWKLQTIITSRLNPLKICFVPIVLNCAAVVRKHKIAMFDSIIAQNRRACIPIEGSSTSAANINNPLHTYFPFDPYVLKKSSRYVDRLVRLYEGSPIVEDTDIPVIEAYGSDSEIEMISTSVSSVDYMDLGFSPTPTTRYMPGITNQSPIM